MSVNFEMSWNLKSGDVLYVSWQPQSNKGFLFRVLEVFFGEVVDGVCSWDEGLVKSQIQMNLKRKGLLG